VKVVGSATILVGSHDGSVSVSMGALSLLLLLLSTTVDSPAVVGSGGGGVTTDDGVTGGSIPSEGEVETEEDASDGASDGGSDGRLSESEELGGGGDWVDEGVCSGGGGGGCVVDDAPEVLDGGGGGGGGALVWVVAVVGVGSGSSGVGSGSSGESDTVVLLLSPPGIEMMLLLSSMTVLDAVVEGGIGSMSVGIRGGLELSEEPEDEVTEGGAEVVVFGGTIGSNEMMGSKIGS
jgi:hypothetical protein